MTLSPGQDAALSAIRSWYAEDDSQVLKMWGAAGTGKTTIARFVPGMLGLEKWCYAAFSGKAAQVLRSKGCVPASTLHSLVYGAPVNLMNEEKKLRAELSALDEFLHWDRTAEISPAARQYLGMTGPEVASALSALMLKLETNLSIQRAQGSFLWPLREEGPLHEADLLIADEVSMVNEKMATDILASGCRVLVLGDPEQLPPVGGEGYFTRTAPDIMLTEVHRQALDSPVLALATRVRLGGGIEPHEYVTGARGLDYTTFDQILCWRRSTRWAAINYVRTQMGREPGVPVPGDRVMNLANNKDLGVFNGQVFTVEEVRPGCASGELAFALREEGSDQITLMDGFEYGFTFQGEKDAEKQRLGWRGETALLTFAQALTVHKAQGSEWPNVCIMDETRAMWSMESSIKGYASASQTVRRWMYTAITRASGSVTLVRK
jgi:exodeoxyribonuclease-5